MAKKKKRCAHKGQIGRSRKDGRVITCLRVKDKVKIKVGDTHNSCTNSGCPFANIDIVRVDEDDRRH